MIGYLDVMNTMHARSIAIDDKDYIFALLMTLGEDMNIAYAFAYDAKELKRHLDSEDEDEYIASKSQEAESMAGKQNIKQLKDLLDESFRAQVQANALNLTDYKFSGQETVQILNSLLKTRIEDLESSSVKDVVGIIKMLTEQGALETGDGGFSKHFIVVKDKFTALCTSCNVEFDCYAGIGAKCPRCGQEYRWSQEENRFYPQPSKL